MKKKVIMVSLRCSALPYRTKHNNHYTTQGVEKIQINLTRKHIYTEKNEHNILKKKT